MLIQSFVMIIVHVEIFQPDVTIEGVRRGREQDNECFTWIQRAYSRSLTTAIAIDHFWKWRTFRSYVLFFTYTVTLYSAFFFAIDSPFFSELTGLLSQLCDGLIAAPQAWKNYVKHSVKNLR